MKFNCVVHYDYRSFWADKVTAKAFECQPVNRVFCQDCNATGMTMLKVWFELLRVGKTMRKMCQLFKE
ncbi:hypothetical protein D1115_20670 [Vibrio alfacsensis]|uniref:Uncharacterized protein n=1 Tax=Vibrio alfacsensis TaxID=1074311 RepID=A0ABN5PNN7_9VIBR|nr:hypothetical protein D1115_20670 [Vibrio alfacsensis]